MEREAMRLYQAQRRALNIAAKVCQDCGKAKEAERQHRRCCSRCAGLRAGRAQASRNGHPVGQP